MSDTTAKPHNWLTADEMCAELRIAKDTLRNLVFAGEIRGYKVGRGKNAQWRFARDEPRRYLEANPIPSAASA
jgi:excisionase family DNA binding protein